MSRKICFRHSFFARGDVSLLRTCYAREKRPLRAKSGRISLWLLYKYVYLHIETCTLQNTYKSMKLKYQFVFQPVGKTYMGVAVGDSAKQFSGMLQLNEVGYDIVSQMTEDISKDEIVDKMLDIYDADRDTVGKYVDEVVEYLKENEVL